MLSIGEDSALAVGKLEVGDLLKVKDTLSQTQLERLVSCLKRGGIICMSTDTVYGLSCVGEIKNAVERLSEIKGSRQRSFLLLIGELSLLNGLVSEIPLSATRLIEHYWPGPLTLVFNAAEAVPRWITGQRQTIAVRYPHCPLCEQLLKALEAPLVSTSANYVGQEPCLTGRQASDSFLEKVDFVIDSGRAPTRLPSTIVDVTLMPPAVVREGAVRVDRVLLSRMEPD